MQVEREVLERGRWSDRRDDPGLYLGSESSQFVADMNRKQRVGKIKLKFGEP